MPLAVVNRYALTLGEQSEIHVGCPIHGHGLASVGFTVNELRDVAKSLGDRARVVDLTAALPAQYRAGNEAGILIIKGGVDAIMGISGYSQLMFGEQQLVKYDEFYFDNRRQKKLHKIARYNAVFGDVRVSHSEDYRQSTVVAYDDVPKFKALRAKLPDVFGEKARELESEGNHYYCAKSGIGFHGDSERRKVICASLGSGTTLHMYWRLPRSSDQGSAMFQFELADGDVYVFSEKATGHDWRSSSKCRLVHGAGAARYVQVEPKAINLKNASQKRKRPYQGDYGHLR
jgi:alkylated DNA repair dioxygenase AlkB